MDKEDIYAEDSNESDEDFCPDTAAADSSVSEEDEDDVVEPEDGEKETFPKSVRKPKRKSGKVKLKTNKKTKRKCGAEREVDCVDNSRRSTRQATESTNGRAKGVQEKDELESDEEDKSRSDALWADFLGDVKSKVPKESAGERNLQSSFRNGDKLAEARSEESVTKLVEEEPKKKTVHEIMDFAGEEVHVEREIKADGKTENKVSSTRTALNGSVSATGVGLKRPAIGGSAGAGASVALGGGGLGSVLNQLGKKKKLSVLEKTKMDWNSFKQDEGIEEQLQTFNKGKDGYLERQDFLQRTDLRQFEIEKTLRQSRRNH